MKSLMGIVLIVLPSYIYAQTIVANSIVGGAYCPETVLLIGYTVSGTPFNTANEFSVELSDVSGTFNGLIIGGPLSSITSDSIASTIPSGTVDGSGYLVRVVSTDPVVVSNNVQLTVAVLTTTISAFSEPNCTGNANGSATVTASGGNGVYTYLWDDPEAQSTASASGLLAGIYSVVVTDENSCSSTSSITLTDPPLLQLSATSTHVTCFDDAGSSADGAIDLTITGGSGFYSTSWSNGSTSEDIINLDAGDYTATVTDSEGCSADIMVTITQPNQLIISETQANLTCNIGNEENTDGAIDITVTGGTGSYTYVWSNGVTTEDLTNLVAGNYTINVTDEAGCESSKTITITEPPLLTISETHINAKCSDSSYDGSINITPSGGTGSYTYLWNNGATTEDLSSLNAGVYTVEVTDASGCTATLSVTITKPSALVVTVTTITDVSCNGSLDGEITISVTDATPPYTYLWSNGATTQNLTGLAGGDYTVTTTDQNGCEDQLTVNVFEPTVLAISETHTNVLCFDGTTSTNDGSIDITATGGNVPYSYLWNNGVTTEDISNLASGTYSVTVTDSKNCQTSLSIIISNPAPISITETHANISCNDDNGLSNDGSIDITVTGGVGLYSYLWQGGETTEDLSGLGSGDYTLTVTDQNNCIATITVTITQPVALSMTVTNPAGICQPETVDITTSFADNFSGTVTYWNEVELQTSVPDPTQISSSGTYYIKKITIDGCYVVRPVVVEIYPVPNLSITNQNAVCSDTSIDLATVYVDNNSTTGTVTYWYDAEVTQAIPDPTDIRTSDTYYIKKETVEGCIDIEPVEIFITIQPSLIITDPSAVCSPNTVDITNSYQDVNNTEGVISYSYDELGDSVIPNPSQIANSGTYFIHKTLSSGCSNTAPVNVAVNPLPNIIITTPTPICQGEFIDLTTTYTESVGLVGTTTFWLDIAATIPVSNPTTITDSGKFYIQFTSDAGCIDIDSVETVVGQYPVLELTEPDAVCDGIVVDLKPTTVDVANISGEFSYWKNSNFTDELVDGLVTVSGTYYIKKTSVLGCASSVSVEVVIIKNPLLIISGDTSACSPNTINLADVFTDTNTTTGQVSYWLDEELTNAVAVSTAIDQTGTYYIFKSTVFGSCTDVVPVNINIFQTPNSPTISLKEDTLFSSALHGNQWYLEQDILPGKVDFFLVPVFNGVYYVSQTLNGCTSDLSEGFLSQPTFVESNLEKIAIEVYPNPASHFLNIAINNYTGFATLFIANIKGEVWFKKTQQISLSNNKFSVTTAYKNKGENIVIITTETTKYVRKIILR